MSKSDDNARHFKVSYFGMVFMRVINIVLVFFVLSLSACMTKVYIPLQDASKDLIERHIIIGKTTKSRVIKCFGEPDTISSKNSNQEIWIYRNKDPHNIRINEEIGKTKELIVTFDSNNLVSEYSMK